MLSIRYAALLIGGLLIALASFAAAPAQAQVFVCTSDPCDTWAPITPLQSAATPGPGAGVTCDQNVTVNQALANANDNRIANAVAAQHGWRIYLKSSLWHAGGRGVPSCTTHLTGYLYKNDEPKTTCHVIAFFNHAGNYWITTCD